MTSIHTNAGAISALQTLRSINAGLKQTQGQVSSGLRVQVATDNAAYWSISTTMRSDRMAISAVTDALGLGAAKVDTAYAGMNAVVEILSEFKARLVAATEDGVDKAKIQAELEQLKAQVVGVAGAASFGGQNCQAVQRRHPCHRRGASAEDVTRGLSIGKKVGTFVVPAFHFASSRITSGDIPVRHPPFAAGLGPGASHRFVLTVH